MRRHTLRRGPSGCVGTVLEPRRPPRSAPGRRRRDGLGQRWALLPRGQRLGRIRRVRNWPVTDWIDIDTLARLLQEGPRAMSVSSPAGLQERQQPQPAIGPLVGSPEPRGQACTLADAPPLLCRRPDCGRPFTPRAAGSRQVFCSKGCRLAFHVEARQLGYRIVKAPALRPDRRVPARHARPASFWRSGVDVATGRRIHMTIMSPSQLLDTLPKRALTPEMGTITP